MRAFLKLEGTLFFKRTLTPTLSRPTGIGGNNNSEHQRAAFRIPILIPSIVLLLTFALSALAQTTTQSQSPGGPEITTQAPNSIDENLAEAKSRPAGILEYGPVSIIDPLWKQFNQATQQVGLKVGMAYTQAFQISSGPGERDAWGDDIDLFGNWRLLGPENGQNNGYLYFYAENRDKLGTPIPPASLDTEFGSLWGTTNGFNTRVFSVKELYWQQQIAGDRLIVRLGKLDPENYYNSNYWQSDSKYFMNQAFSSFPVRAFPGNGLGTNITVKLSDQWYVSTGFQDAEGSATTVGFNTFFGDFDLFGAGEVGFTPTIPGVGAGTYRFTPWYRAAGQSKGMPHDAGFDVSFEQHVGSNFIPFFRYGVGEGNINGIQQMISGGIGWQGKILSRSDVIGIGGAWGQPSNHDLRDQYVAEVFYRIQVSPDNQFMLGYQLIIDPSSNPDTDVVGVFEIRWRVSM